MFYFDDFVQVIFPRKNAVAYAYLYDPFAHDQQPEISYAFFKIHEEIHLNI